MSMRHTSRNFYIGNRHSELPPSPCEGCKRNCKGERCSGWERWFSRSWSQVRELFY